MEQLIILSIKIKRASKDQAMALEKYLSREFEGIDGYIVKTIVMPKADGDPEVNCIYPSEPTNNEDIIKILDDVNKRFQLWEGTH